MDRLFVWGARELQTLCGTVSHTGQSWPFLIKIGSEPIWSPKSDELLFFTYDCNNLIWMSAPFTTGPNFKFKPAKLLFKGDYLDYGGRNWDVTPDGRILTLKPVNPSQTYTQIRVVHNWFEEIKSKFEAGS